MNQEAKAQMSFGGRNREMDGNEGPAVHIQWRTQGWSLHVAG